MTRTEQRNGHDKMSAGSKERFVGERLQAPTLVCGGAGFLGAHMCARLLQEGRRVVCLDNFSTSSREAVEELLAHPRFELVFGDIATLDTDELQAGEIYNFACAASPVHYQRDPLGTLMSSVRGMHSLLRLARRCNARIFQASTSEIYGNPTLHPQPESYWGHVNTMGPRSCYDEGKRCAETLCYIYHQQYGVQVRLARIFNTYGPGMRLSDGRVVINFIVQALAGKPITVYGDGSQTRSFCYVDDLIEVISRLMFDDALTGPVNIGNPQEVEVGELARSVVRLTGSRSRIVTRALPTDDPPRRRPDIALAEKMLGWRPRINLETGLMRTIADVERRLSQGDPSLLPATRKASFVGMEGAL